MQHLIQRQRHNKQTALETKVATEVTTKFRLNIKQAAIKSKWNLKNKQAVIQRFLETGNPAKLP